MKKSAVLRFLTFVGFCFFYVQVIAQEVNSAAFKVVDSASNQAIVFATIILQNSGVGVISDDNGNFRIPKRFIKEDEQIRVSCIGYKTQIFDIFKPVSNDVIILELVQSVETLKEVVLLSNKKEKKYSAKKIVKLALGRIPNNYPRNPFGYISYYRDYQKVINSTNLSQDHPLKSAAYVNLNEGIIKLFDAGFGTNKFFDDQNQSVLFQFGQNQNFLIDTISAVPYDNYNVKFLKGVTFSPLGGNELHLLHIGDCIRNYDQESFSFMNVMNKDFTKQHLFRIDKIMYLDDEPIYKIDFISRIHSMDGYYSGGGSIYIGKDDFGIHKLNYVTRDVRKDKDLYEVNIEYKKTDKLYYLNYLTFNNYFDIKHGDIFKVANLVYHYESNSFHVFFNRPLNIKTVDKTGRTLTFYCDNKKLEIEKIELIDPKTLKVSIYPFYKNMDREIVEKDIKYSIKNVEDLKGNIINEGPLIGLKQFREIFVQEVLQELKLDSTQYFVKKGYPLSDSRTNPDVSLRKYWVNSPLKESKQ